MRKLLFSSVAVGFILLGTSWFHTAQAQQSTAAPASKPQDSQKGQASSGTGADAEAPQDSVAAAARHAKEQKKSAPKSAKVFTNENIPTSGRISSVGGGASATEATPAAPASEAAAKPAANDEKAWRDKFAALHHKLDQDQQDLEVMQRELGALNLQYYSDPVKAMQQQYTRSDINDKTAQIEAKKKAIEADQQAISDAEDDLRKAGGPPGWAR